MGYSISHGSNPNGQLHRSYSGLAEFGRELAYVLSARDWRTVRHLFDGKRLSDDELVPPATARKVADILSKAATHPKITPEGARDAREFSAAASRAARHGEPWMWSG
ncbi:hypothetical protein ADK53_28720 [Streptomyces sp. WM6373]|uniref:DUF7739 domain-containing protein n=1 Tax=Streptomyces sp. WM6373 TaxID=1415556 RepID=UPI0006AE6134|nr:hypothetical protein [Streptomyces sp. WM6373]KOU30204.1 hypothetical protein ADK53_28720 [Streptomyces sp. WM6373]